MICFHWYILHFRAIKPVKEGAFLQGCAKALQVCWQSTSRYIALCPPSPVFSWSMLGSVLEAHLQTAFLPTSGMWCSSRKGVRFWGRMGKDVWAELWLWSYFVLLFFFLFLLPQVKKVFQLYRRLSSEELHAATFYRATTETSIYTWPTKWKASPNPA